MTSNKTSALVAVIKHGNICGHCSSTTQAIPNSLSWL